MYDRFNPDIYGAPNPNKLTITFDPLKVADTICTLRKKFIDAGFSEDETFTLIVKLLDESINNMKELIK